MDFNILVHLALVLGEIMEEELQEAGELLKEVLEDRSVPRNIRTVIEEVIKGIENPDSTNLSSAIYALDDISNDINMPSHTRTEIWQIISLLESVKEKIK